MSLKIKGLKKAFSQGQNHLQILKNIDVEIAEKQVVAIVGQSGSGKSTLLSLLAGLEYADSGQIILSGKDLMSMSEGELAKFRAKHISIVFQQYHLVSHLTALENVILPLEITGQEDQAEAKATALLSDLGLGHRLHHLPRELSGGECQRVAIARALIAEPDLILADEPSGNLDQETGRKVMDLFFKTIRDKQKMTVVVTHSEDVARQCDRIYKLVEGQLQEWS